MPEVFYSPDDIAALLDHSWTVEVSEARPRPATTPEGDKAELREVEPGVSFDGLVVIDKGLTTADRVIVDNLLRVRPGVKVQIQQ